MMSDKKLIGLASVLLALWMLLVSCSDGTKTPNPEENDTSGLPTQSETETEAQTEAEEEHPLIGPVEPVLKNFFTFKSVNPWKTLTKAERLDGTLTDSSADHAMIVLRKAQIDPLSRATETYTVYNTELGKVVLTVSNSYTYGKDPSVFDWDNLCVTDPTVRYPEQVLDVRLLSVMDCHLIEVRRAKITPVADAEEGKDRYDIAVSHEYYDAAGQKLADSKNASSPRMQSMTEEGLALNLAGVSVLLDATTGLAVSVTDSDGGIVRLGYTDQTERYGYYLHQTQAAANGCSRGFLEVYDKQTNTRVLRYYPDESTDLFAYVMQNGDLFLQYLDWVEEGSGMAYDVVLNGENYAMRSYIVDVPSGDATEIACPYLIFSMDDREEFSEKYNMESKGIFVTENAVNVCIGLPIENKTPEITKMKVVVLNNDGSVMYQMQSIVPEHSMNALSANPVGFTILPKGDYLVELDGVLHADRAIVSADGRVRSYLRSEAVVVGEYVVIAEGIYDYDLNCLYRFEEEGFSLETVVGNRILVSKPDDEASADGSRMYWEIFRQDDRFESRPLFGESAVTPVELRDDYVIVRNSETGKYSLYNVNLSHVLTTQSEMRVDRLEDHYIVATDILTEEGSVSVFYTLWE